MRMFPCHHLEQRFPRNSKNPAKFPIPCALQELDRTNALADSGASINLLPYSIYKQLELGALTSTRITLELANRSIITQWALTEDVVVRVDGFTFLADFVVVNFEPDPRVPIILGRHFLRTTKALIDLYEEKLTLRVGSDELLHPSSSSMKTSDNLEKFADELTFLDSLPLGDDNDEIDAFLAMEISTDYEEGYYDLEGDVLYLESLLCDETTHKLLPNDPIQEEIDLFPGPDDVENDDSEDEDNSTFLPENESSILEPSSPRPPPEPPDVCLNFEPNLAMKNDFVKLNEDFNQGEKILSLDVEDVESFTFVIWTFLSYFTYPEDSPLLFSFGSEDFIFDPGISAYSFFSYKPGVFHSSLRTT
ncbi:reverse transcriptase domain-containing protein [Tanacetum coccineum]